MGGCWKEAPDSLTGLQPLPTASSLAGRGLLARAEAAPREIGQLGQRNPPSTGEEELERGVGWLNPSELLDTQCR